MTHLYSKEFTAHGLSDIVTVICRDVCQEGFGMDSLAADAGVY